MRAGQGHVTLWSHRHTCLWSPAIAPGFLLSEVVSVVKCSNCGIALVPTGNGYTHAPGKGGCNATTPVETPWQEIQPADPAIDQCPECAALVLATGLAHHLQWHSEQPGHGTPK